MWNEHGFHFAPACDLIKEVCTAETGVVKFAPDIKTNYLLFKEHAV